MEDLPRIGEYAAEAGAKFFDYYATATGSGLSLEARRQAGGWYLLAQSKDEPGKSGEQC